MRSYNIYFDEEYSRALDKREYLVFDDNYVPPPKVKGDILVSVRILGVGIGVTVWYSPYLMN